jgi:hypothetical protein
MDLVITPPSPADSNGDGTGEEKRTFTQAELNALFGERGRQAKQAAISELLKDLGVESPEAIKAALKAATEAKAAQMTELEKARAQAAEALKKAEEAEQARTATEAKALERLMRAEVIAVASQLGFNDSADAWLYIDRAAIKVKEDDSFEGIDKALEAVVKSKPYLIKTSQPSGGTPTRKPRLQQPPESAPAPVVKRIVTL